MRLRVCVNGLRAKKVRVFELGLLEKGVDQGFLGFHPDLAVLAPTVYGGENKGSWRTRWFRNTTLQFA